MAGIINAEALRRSYKTPGVIMSHDLPLFGFRMQYINILPLKRELLESVCHLIFFFIFTLHIYIELKLNMLL